MSSSRSNFTLAALLLPLLGCASAPPPPVAATPVLPSQTESLSTDLAAPTATSLLDEVPAVTAEAAREREPAAFRIATWNIENLSPRKLADGERADAIVGIVRQFEVVAVEELSDSHLGVGQQFLDLINSGSAHEYAASISPRSGVHANDRRSQEQYGVYFRDDMFDVVSEELYPDRPTNRFVREPWITRLQHVESGTTFALVTIHAVPRKGPTAAEIDALADVVSWVVEERDEPNVIVLGDMNAGVGCSYITQAALDATRLRQEPFVWAVADDADTNVAQSQCAHDRIVMNEGGASLYAEETGVENDAFDPEALDLSDHWPVWMLARVP